MAVPKFSQLRPGVGVNVVLKADQPSSKLTIGPISEILTRGDHPRGIKVRLSNGQVGRVQSLSTPSEPSMGAQVAPYARTSYSIGSGQEGREGQRGRFALQEDYRQDPTPHESRSLADYIRLPSSSKANGHVPDAAYEGNTMQAQLEKDFPKLDSALIAAILADHEKVEDARRVLSSVS